jgi:hypothetical protein
MPLSLTHNGGNCSINVDVFGRGEPEIRGRLQEFYPHFRSACVTPTKVGYATSSFRPILRIVDD